MTRGLLSFARRTYVLPRMLLTFLLVAAACAYADVAVPPLKTRVTDLTGTLSSQQQATLEQTLAEFEKRKGSQIAVLILPTTQPDSVEQYAVRVEEAWKLGRKGIDDSALLVIAKDDRKLRIEVGYGLEGVLNDATAKRIIADDITPRFKQGDFYGGISAGVERMIKVIDGEPLPPPKAASAQHAERGFDFNTLLVIGFILVFVVGGVLRAIFGRFLGAGIVGGIAGFLAWTLGGALFIGIIASVIAFIFSLMGGGSRGGWGGGGFGGGGFSSGGGFGGGGFSGGGGGSGGGGSSGSW